MLLKIETIGDFAVFSFLFFPFPVRNMATVTLPKRDPRGRFAKKNAVRKKGIRSSIQIEHNYCVGSACDGNECRDDLCAMHPPLKSKNIRADGWKFTPDARSFRRRVFAFHYAVKLPHTNIILS